MWGSDWPRHHRDARHRERCRSGGPCCRPGLAAMPPSTASWSTTRRGCMVFDTAAPARTSHLNELERPAMFLLQAPEVPRPRRLHHHARALSPPASAATGPTPTGAAPSPIRFWKARCLTMRATSTSATSPGAGSFASTRKANGRWWPSTTASPTA